MSRTPTPRASGVRYLRRAPPAQVPASYHVLPLQKIKAVLGTRFFCDPDQLITTKQRNKLAAANKALCYLTRGSFKEDQHTQRLL